VPFTPGYIPSPSSGLVRIGSLSIHLYGLTLLVAILLCVWMTTVRWRAAGGDSDLVVRVAVWGVAFGIIGARAYHDITSWNEVPTPKWEGVFEIWKGGLGVWGGILLGTLAGVVVVRRAGQSATAFMDATAPGLLLAQGIGRIGNWWNQELYGKPTTLPWGLKIDLAHRAGLPLQYLNASAYHPTFLYELLWDLAGVALLLWLSRRRRFRPPALFALYVAYYCFGRFFEELLRIDPSHHFLGLRLNAWVTVVLFVAASAFFVWWELLGRGGPDREAPRERRPRPRPLPEGPRMTIPRGRVRPRG
jgi:phosphatidylglycerol---prolipoprotein diacylglyceryl transferase